MVINITVARKIAADLRCVMKLAPGGEGVTCVVVSRSIDARTGRKGTA
jgi:hypothetical protein